MKNEKIIIATIIGVALLGYALIGRQTKLDLAADQERIEGQEALAEQQELQKREERLTACMVTANKKHWDTWKLNCDSDFLYFENEKIKSCSVPNHLAPAINKATKETKDRCVELYGN